jgi:hypothetical protein
MESPDPQVLRSPVCSCHVSPVSLGPNEKRSLPHKTGAPTTSSVLQGSMRGHSNRPGRSCLRTLQLPGTVTPLWHHSKSFRIGQSTSALPLWPLPLQSPAACVAVSCQDLLIWGLLFSSLFILQFIQGKTGLTFLSCSKLLPIWNPQFGGQEGYHVVSTKTPQALWR